MSSMYIWQSVQKNGFQKTHFVQERRYPSLCDEVSYEDSDSTKVNLRLRFPHLLDYTKKTDSLPADCFSEEEDTVFDDEWDASENDHTSLDWSFNDETEKEESPDISWDNQGNKELLMPDWELDLYLHFMAAVDLYSGYNRNNQMMDEVHDKICSGIYGEKAKKLFKEASLKEQAIVLRNFCNQHSDGLEIFHNAYKERFPHGLIYLKDDCLIVYLDMEETKEVRQYLELLQIMFLPLDYTLKIHFKYHMGIIGIDQTMKIGKIRII